MMINVIAVEDSLLRTLPISAEYGASLIFYYAIAGYFFYTYRFNYGRACNRMAKYGGVYVWVTEAFGEKSGFLTIWLQSGFIMPFGILLF